MKIRLVFLLILIALVIAAIFISLFSIRVVEKNIRLMPGTSRNVELPMTQTPLSLSQRPTARAITIIKQPKEELKVAPTSLEMKKERGPSLESTVLSPTTATAIPEPEPEEETEVGIRKIDKRPGPERIKELNSRDIIMY